MRIFRILLFLAGLLFSGSLAASAIISGVVTSQSSGNPISGATVTLIKGSSQIIGTTSTALDGSYSFTGVNPGQYTVTAGASGFQTQAVGAQAKNNQTTTVNFALLPNPGTIAGTVTDAVTTNPIVGATVEVTYNNIVIFSTLTDGLGNYSITGIACGSYVVLAMHKIQQKDLPLVLLGAGLPSLAGESKSYAERLFSFPDIGALAQEDAIRALRNPVQAAGIDFEAFALEEIS